MLIALKLLGYWCLAALCLTPFMCAFLIGANPYRHNKEQRKFKMYNDQFQNYKNQRPSSSRFIS